MPGDHQTSAAAPSLPRMHDLETPPGQFRVLILSLLAAAIGGRLTVLQAGTKDPIVAYPEELLSEAVARMLRHGIGRLPVVSREEPNRVIGYLGRSQVMAARERRLEDEYVREPGWIHTRFLP